MSDSWLLLRIPRSASPGELSAVLGAGDTTLVEAHLPDVATAIDRILAAASARGVSLGEVTLIYPLDGRHETAHVVLDQAQKRGYGFTRHPPAGAAHHLIDLDGADAEPGLSADAVGDRIDALGKAARAAISDSEMAEAMAILRQVITIGARHLSWWDANTLWALANLVRVSAGTGAEPNVREACELARHAVAQPLPDPLESPVRTLSRLHELAQNCQGVGDPRTADAILRAGIELARRTEGDGHANHLAMLNNYGLFLSALKDPKAEGVLRDLLARTRATLGEEHANVAVVLANLAELLENTGRADEAAPLRAEVARIRGQVATTSAPPSK
jgi:hypothetical protein